MQLFPQAAAISGKTALTMKEGIFRVGDEGFFHVETGGITAALRRRVQDGLPFFCFEGVGKVDAAIFLEVQQSEGV